MPSVTAFGASRADDPRTLYGVGAAHAQRPTPGSGPAGAAAAREAGDAIGAGPPAAGDAPSDVVVRLSDKARGLAKGSPDQQLSDDEKKQIQALEKADSAVRQHEAAHKAAAGGNAGAATYSYTVGPDGKRYATGGEVSVDVSPVSGDPEATLRKMEQIARAALAPADPSGADRAVAAQAQAAAAQVRQEIAQGGGKEEKNGSAAGAPSSAGAPPLSGQSQEPAPARGASSAGPTAADAHTHEGDDCPRCRAARETTNRLVAAYSPRADAPRGTRVSVAA